MIKVYWLYENETDNIFTDGRHLMGHAAAMRQEGISYGTINVYPDCTLGGPANTAPKLWT